MHYADIFDLALQIIEIILSENPQYIDALTLKGDIYCHQEKYDLALEFVQRSLTLNPENTDALEVKADIFEETKRWKELAEIAEQLLRQDEDYGIWAKAIQYRAMANMGMGDFPKAQADIDELAKGKRYAQRKAKYLQKRLSEQIAEYKCEQSVKK